MARATPNAEPKVPKKNGRPLGSSGYRPEMCEPVRKVCALGAIDTDIADFLNVSERTVRSWRTQYPDFAEACRLGKEIADKRVEDSLFRMATGYVIETEKVFCSEGQIIRAETFEHVNPVPSAAIFWLKNRQGWRDSQEITGKDGAPLMPEVRVFLGRRPTEAEQGG